MNKNMHDKIKTVANIATFPQRATTFEKAILSILPQVDRLNVYLNDYQSVPDILKNEKITAVLSSETEGDLKDNGKFYFLNHVSDDTYYFTIDDDIVYPDDYVATLVEKLRHYDHKVAVGVHGVMFFADFQSFRASHTPFFFTGALDHDVSGTTLGTGTVAFYKKTFADLSLRHFETTGATDLWFAGYCKEHAIPQICVARRAQWLQDIKHLFPEGAYTLWKSTEKTEKVQNEIVRRFRLWDIKDSEFAAYRLYLEQWCRAQLEREAWCNNERENMKGALAAAQADARSASVKIGGLQEALAEARSDATAQVTALNNKCAALEHSKSFRLGNLFFRSVKTPYKLLTFPLNAARTLISAPVRSVTAGNDQQTFWCPFCRRYAPFGDAGSPARKNAYCLGCGSLERHRFLFYVYNMMFLQSPRETRVLHMAPEKCLHDLLVAQSTIRYVAADAEPERFDFTDCRKEDFCHMRFADKQFDVILANHVMEHIKDEQRCLSEIRRCLKDDGLAIIAIPYQVGLAQTFEDATITSEEDREKYFSQKDHVRLYGEDAAQRFEKAGFIVQRIEETIFEEDFVQTRRLRSINTNGLNNGGYFLLRKRCEARNDRASWR